MTKRKTKPKAQVYRSDFGKSRCLHNAQYWAEQCTAEERAYLAEWLRRKDHEPV